MQKLGNVDLVMAFFCAGISRKGDLDVKAGAFEAVKKRLSAWKSGRS